MTLLSSAFPSVASDRTDYPVIGRQALINSSEVHVKYWLVLVVLALSPALVAAQERVKIGFIDLQRAIMESASGKKAKARFEAQVKKAESDLLKEKQELERLKADLDKKGPLLKDDERRNLEADLQRRYVQYQRTMGDHQQDLRQKEGELTGDILKDLQQIVTDIGKSEKFTLIFERSQILYNDQAIDITSKVIETYNSRTKTK
jgi:outer membrane protein